MEPVEVAGVVKTSDICSVHWADWKRTVGGQPEKRWTLAGHMGLIAIAYVCGQFCEAPSTAYAAS